MAAPRREARPRESGEGTPLAVGPAPLPAWIRWARWIVPLIALLLVGLAATMRTGSVPGLPTTPREFKGAAPVAGAQMAADFTLTDQFGQQQSLSGFRGKPVALTFLYTNCIDVCPLMAWNMHLAYEQLGNDAKRIALLAVSVDPERDTIAQIRAFSDQRQLTNQWHFLTGNRPVLEQVWRTYGILAQPYDADGKPIPGADLVNARPRDVEHAAPVLLIDRHGRVRAVMPPDFEADALADNLRILLAE